MRKSIADEDEAIEAWESSKLSDILDPEASGTGLWERTETSLGVGGWVKNPHRGVEEVRLEKGRGGRGRCSGGVDEFTAIRQNCVWEMRNG